MRKSSRALAILAFALLVMGLVVPAAAEDAQKPLFRVDGESMTTWKEPLDNVRFLTKGAYVLKPLGEKKYAQYGIDPKARPSTEGMDSLNISGSATFSEGQFRELAENIRRLAAGKKVYVVDCRQESHGLINGISLSWYDNWNWVNRGMTVKEVGADENTRFGALPGKTITAYTVKSNHTVEKMEIAVEKWMSERELVESEGFGYLRLSCPDHCWPGAEEIDRFIAFVRNLDMNNVWLHFHCQAGEGRTGVFMTIYDMMKNPGVPFDDIILRQTMAGSSYLLYAKKNDFSWELNLRTKRIRQIYEYLQEMQGEYRVSWGVWLNER